MRCPLCARLEMFLIVALAVQGCSNSSGPHTVPATRSAASATFPSNPTDENWVGIYSSPKEIGGFSGTVLEIQRNLTGGGFEYWMRSYSDARMADEIGEARKFGELLIDSDRLYVPVASGFMNEGKPILSASITRYTRMTIRGHTVLLRDDALKVYRDQNRLYDYGILIKVDDHADLLADLDRVRHESIKVLYENPNKPWRDPFVNGPNPR